MLEHGSVVLHPRVEVGETPVAWSQQSYAPTAQTLWNRKQSRPKLRGHSGTLARAAVRLARCERCVPPRGPVCLHDRSPPEESLMNATYTFDVFSSLDGFGSVSGGDWGGYWGKQGPELLDHRLALSGEPQRMVFGANAYRRFAAMLASSTEESDV